MLDFMRSVCCNKAMINCINLSQLHSKTIMAGGDAKPLAP